MVAWYARPETHSPRAECGLVGQVVGEPARQGLSCENVLEQPVDAVLGTSVWYVAVGVAVIAATLAAVVVGGVDVGVVTEVVLFVEVAAFEAVMDFVSLVVKPAVLGLPLQLFAYLASTVVRR